MTSEEGNPTANPLAPKVKSTDKVIDIDQKEVLGEDIVPREFEEIEDEYLDEPEHDKNSRLRSKKNKFYGCMYICCTNPFYNLFVFILILANTVTLCIDDFP